VREASLEEAEVSPEEAEVSLEEAEASPEEVEASPDTGRRGSLTGRRNLCSSLSAFSCWLPAPPAVFDKINSCTTISNNIISCFKLKLLASSLTFFVSS
jgi:hypothetical protein